MSESFCGDRLEDSELHVLEMKNELGRLWFLNQNNDEHFNYYIGGGGGDQQLW